MEKIRKPRVLLTGFTPFGGETVNPALEAVKRVRCPEAELRILEVPTVFGDSARLVTAEMDAFRPDVVLCGGQAAASYGGVYLLSAVLPLPAVAAKVLVDTLLFFLSFQIQRRWVFGEKREKTHRKEENVYG